MPAVVFDLWTSESLSHLSYLVTLLHIVNSLFTCSLGVLLTPKIQSDLISVLPTVSFPVILCEKLIIINQIINLLFKHSFLTLCP